MNGQRFVLNVGAIAEEYPGMPEQNGDVVLWDRQEQKPVVTIHRAYANAICFERAGEDFGPGDAPFTNLENFFNSLDNEALESEGLAITK